MRIFYTDGSANPNPGPGGFAVIEKVGEEGKPIVLGAEKNSSNIRMEGRALIAALNEAAGEKCEIYTDSEFWINVLTKWAPGWQKNGWYKKPLVYDKNGKVLNKNPKNEIKNLDIVKELYELYKKSAAKLFFVRGHVGMELNELADEWANKARRGAKL